MANTKKTTKKVAPKKAAGKKKPAKKKESEMQKAKRKYANGTTYKDPEGKTHKRKAKPGTPDGQAYCARSNKQPRTPKVKVRRQAWGCSGSKSNKK